MPTKNQNITEPEPDQETQPELDSQSAEADPQDEHNTFTFKRSHFYAVMTMLAFAVGVLLGYVVWGYQPDGGQAKTAQAAAQPAGPTEVAADATEAPKFVRYDIPSEGYPSLGPADAPITIVEFSDYQCPFCRRWHEEVYEALLAAYPGKIRLVYRNLPLTSIHHDAQPAAEAALCAGEQDAYFPFHNKLFSSDNLIGSANPNGKSSVDPPIRETAINVERVKAMLNCKQFFHHGPTLV